jgi:hypothetical protein
MERFEKELNDISSEVRKLCGSSSLSLGRRLGSASYNIKEYARQLFLNRHYRNTFLIFSVCVIILAATNTRFVQQETDVNGEKKSSRSWSRILAIALFATVPYVVYAVYIKKN